MCRGEEKSMQNLDRFTGNLQKWRCGWNDNIKSNCKYIELEEVEWIDLAQDKNK